MIPFRKTIGFRLILMGFLILILPLLIDLVVVFTRRYESRVATTKRYLTESAILRVLPLASYAPFPPLAFDVLVEGLGIGEHFPDAPEGALNQQLMDLVKINQLENIALLRRTEEGRYIINASAHETWIGRDATEFFTFSTPFEVLEQDDDPVATYLSYNDDLDMYIVLAKRFKDKNGLPIGLVAVTMETQEWMNQLLAEDTTYYPVRFALLNPSTVIVAATEPALLFHYFHPLKRVPVHSFHGEGLRVVNLPLAPSQHLKVTASKTKDNFFRFFWHGQEQFGVVEPMPWWEYSLLAYVSKREVYALPLRDMLGIFVSYLLILICGGTCVYFIAKKWMKPIQLLGSIMVKVQQGDFAARYVAIVWAHRVNILGAIFNEMVEKLLANKGRAEEERVQSAILAQELRLGKEAQQRLLKEPNEDLGPVEVAQCYIPAREVGGDFYDVFRKPNGKLILMVADASGKGVLACCYSLTARNILHTLAMEHDDLGKVLVAGNNLFCEDTGTSGMFVTLEMVQYDPAIRELTFHSLGHNPGIVCRCDGTIELLSSGDIAMGVAAKKGPLAIGQRNLVPGDMIVLYTDGVTEMHNPQSELFGVERLITLIRSQHYLTAQQLLEQIKKAIYDFASGRAQFDDVTLIVVKIHG